MKGACARTHVADVLLGNATPFVKAHGLDALSTWNLLAGFRPEHLRILLETLVRAGCARVEADGSDRIHLTAKGLRVARREEPEFTIRWPSDQPARPRPLSLGGAAAAHALGGVPSPVARTKDVFGADLSPAARTRANALRAWRKDTADGLGVAAFRIMSNKTLFSVAEENPRSLSQLSRLVYRQTLNEYGEDILDVLADANDA